MKHQCEEKKSGSRFNSPADTIENRQAASTIQQTDVTSITCSFVGPDQIRVVQKLEWKVPDRSWIVAGK